MSQVCYREGKIKTFPSSYCLLINSLVVSIEQLYWGRACEGEAWGRIQRPDENKPSFISFYLISFYLILFVRF